MAKFDPPSDPYGNEKSCRICDKPLEWNYLLREWECIDEHESHPTSEYNTDEPEAYSNADPGL